MRRGAARQGWRTRRHAIIHSESLLNGADMAIIRPASELQRNINAIYELCRDTGEPVYITRNGEKSLVVMDADAFARRLGPERRAFKRETHVLEAMEASGREAGGGDIVSIEEARALRETRS